MLHDFYIIYYGYIINLGHDQDAVNVSRIFSHTELKQKFIEVSNTALNLQKRNDELEREIRQLREQQDLRHKIERTTDGYFTLKGENPQHPLLYTLLGCKTPDHTSRGRFNTRQFFLSGM